jgi:hypothetical protein
MNRPASSLWTGALWGALGGLVLALLMLRRHPHLYLHLHGIEVAAVFAICLALGTAIGAGIARLRDRRTGDATLGSARSLRHPEPDQHDR